jgi:uroporphyrinogen-III synthase
VPKSLRILVTRPSPYNEELCQLLRTNGYNPIALPVITLNKWLAASTLQQLKQRTSYHWLIFISQAAVLYGLELATTYCGSITTNYNIAAIGATTATALQQAGYQHILYPQQWSSEGLLALSPLKQVRQQSIAIFCGRNTNDLLAITLRARGAQVSLLPVYQRQLTTVDITSYQYLLANNLIDVIMATSVEILTGLQQLFASTPQLKHLPLLVTSQRIMLAATMQGFNNCLLVADASSNNILQGLQQLRS